MLAPDTSAARAPKRLRDLFAWPDRLRYLAWRAVGSPWPIRVKIGHGPQIWLRSPRTTDPGTAREVFLEKAYRFPNALCGLAPETVVDLGANVGYSVAHWLHEYPKARVVAFEPHPAHVALLYRHLEDNGGLWRCRVVPAAAGVADAEVFLTDQGNESAVAAGAAPGRFAVPARDFFREVGAGVIDLLKMDIEGGEFALLGDDRFGGLHLRAVVIEWHNTPEVPDGKAWCLRRLAELGFTVERGVIEYANAGLLWGWKP